MPWRPPSARDIARVGRRGVRVPTALLAQIAHEIVQVGIVQRIFVARHAGSALAQLLLHVGVVHGRPGQQGGALVEAFELGNVFGELVMAEPALVIVDLPATLGSARRRLPEFVDFKRALIVVLLGPRLLRERARARRDNRQRRGGQHPLPMCGRHRASLASWTASWGAY